PVRPELGSPHPALHRAAGPLRPGQRRLIPWHDEPQQPGVLQPVLAGDPGHRNQDPPVPVGRRRPDAVHRPARPAEGGRLGAGQAWSWPAGTATRPRTTGWRRPTRWRAVTASGTRGSAPATAWGAGKTSTTSAWPPRPAAGTPAASTPAFATAMCSSSATRS